MKKVYKYTIPESQYDLCTLEMPAGSELLDVQWQDRTLVLWALVWAESTRHQIRKFRVFGTGESIPDNLYSNEYVGTAQSGIGEVWHLFEVTNR